MIARQYLNLYAAMVYIHACGYPCCANSQKGNKQTFKNYIPVSLLPIWSETFERILYNEMFGFFLDKEIISANQSGLKPRDHCINQILS